MITLLGVTYKDYIPWEKKIHDNYDLIMGLRKVKPEAYGDKMDELNQLFYDFRCPNPDCKAKHQMGIFGFYQRHVENLKSVLFSVDERKVEILRLKCRSCLSTHAVLPNDIIPYTIATVDTIALYVYATFENPAKRFSFFKMQVKSDSVKPGRFPKVPVKSGPAEPGRFPKMMARSKAPKVEPPQQRPVPQANGAGSAHTAASTRPCPPPFDIRANFKFFRSLLFGQGHLVPQISQTRNYPHHPDWLSVSTVYHFREKFKEGWAYVTSSLRFSGLWNKTAHPTLGEGIRILFEHSLTDIQKKMFTVHGMPFLFPVSRRRVNRSGSSFPYTGYAC